jgi:L-cysteine S-thiosulfotransferase
MRGGLAMAALAAGLSAHAALSGWVGPAAAQDAAARADDSISQSLTGRAGDAVRGREIAFSRERGNCPICHVLPAPDEALHGDVGPSLKGVASRLTEGQLRSRVVDARRTNPASVMPSYHRLNGLKRVQAVYAGKTVLSAEEIEDVLAYLMTLR